jgi:hypothetical protein
MCVPSGNSTVPLAAEELPWSGAAAEEGAAEEGATEEGATEDGATEEPLCAEDAEEGATDALAELLLDAPSC